MKTFFSQLGNRIENISEHGFLYIYTITLIAAFLTIYWVLEFIKFGMS